MMITPPKGGELLKLGGGVNSYKVLGWRQTREEREEREREGERER